MGLKHFEGGIPYSLLWDLVVYISTAWLQDKKKKKRSILASPDGCGLSHDLYFTFTWHQKHKKKHKRTIVFPPLGHEP